MIALGELLMDDGASIVVARRKIHELVDSLRMGEFNASRLAIAVSELGRHAVRTQAPLTVRVLLAPRAYDSELVFECVSNTESLRALGGFFDVAEHILRGGARVFIGRKRLDMTAHTLTPEFIEAQRALLANQSREQLLHDLEVANRKLGAYGEQLEEQVAQRTDELREAKEAAERANAARSRFLSNMSHEMRTPMNGIMGFADLMSRSELTAEQRDHMRHIRRSAECLLELIDDVLDLARIDSGRIDLESVPLDLFEILEDVHALCDRPAKAKSVALRIDLADDIPRLVIGDPTRIRQVLLNLVSNAVKFTERGEVVMSVQRTQQPSKGERLVFVVRDTGIGMDAQSIERIFEEFVQADNSTTRRYGGTGLGLAICRRLISLMQGTLTVESQVGQGSTFQFELDLACAPAGYRLPDLDLCRWASGEALRGARILLVDDNLINRKVGMALLRSAGADVDVAEHGLEAIQKVQTEAYHAVLMDIQMPELDGYEATRAIRRFAHLADLPIIAMTAHAMLGIREQCLNAGMNDYVSKPIDPAQMVTVLLRHMDLTTADGWAAEAVAL